MDTDAERHGLQWHVGVWDRISQLYRREVDPRFATVVANVVRRGDVKAGDQVVDLGTGTGSVAIGAAGLVGPAGQITGVDISPDMLALTRRRVIESGYTSIDLREGRAEQLHGRAVCASTAGARRRSRGEVLAGVTTAQLPPERRQEAKEAVQAVMWPHGRGPRHSQRDPVSGRTRGGIGTMMTSDSNVA